MILDVRRLFAGVIHHVIRVTHRQIQTANPSIQGTSPKARDTHPTSVSAQGRAFTVGPRRHAGTPR
jgi:hypothetical protein